MRLAAWALLVSCSAWPSGHGRVLTSPCHHLGIQAATSCGPTGCDGLGTTVQWSTDAPFCRQIYPIDSGTYDDAQVL